MNETIVLRQHITASPEAVWKALSDPADLERWLCEHADVSLHDGQYAFWGRFDPSGAGGQRLLEADPPRTLRYVWPLGVLDGQVELALEPDDAGTSVTLTHTNAPLRVPDEVFVRDWWQLSLDNLADFVEGRPMAGRVDFPMLRGLEARFEVDVDAPPEEVFAALVEPDQLERWLARGATVEPRVGGRYDLGWDIGPTRILELVPNERLAFDWRQGGGGSETVIRWELEGSDGKTHLTVVQSGFVSEGEAASWTIALASRVASLKRMLEVGAGWRPVERLQYTA